jgi:hypothetical protein
MKPIYIWNKMSKYVMFQCGIDFQFFPLHIAIIINIWKQLSMQLGPPTFFETYIS